MGRKRGTPGQPIRPRRMETAGEERSKVEGGGSGEGDRRRAVVHHTGCTRVMIEQRAWSQEPKGAHCSNCPARKAMSIRRQRNLKAETTSPSVSEPRRGREGGRGRRGL